jgi:hypothetical protein
MLKFSEKNLGGFAMRTTGADEDFNTWDGLAS